MVDEEPALRFHFPVLSRVAYLNAGTNGPLPAPAAEAAAKEWQAELAEGRTAARFARRRELAEALRAAYSRLLGCAPGDVALTSCTSEGLTIFLLGLRLRARDEILTSAEEHPGLLGALQAARERFGVAVRVVPFARLAEEIGPRTRVVAASHVSWVSGALAPEELRERPERTLLLLDGAQGVGAVPLAVAQLQADGYAGAGQKWLCGPDGLGMLYTSPRAREEVVAWRRGYANFERAELGLDAPLYPDSRRFDAYALSAPLLSAGLAAVQLLERYGIANLQRRAAELANGLAVRLQERGREVVGRGNSTLVSFRSARPSEEVARLGERGVVVREIPGFGLVRASVGAWNDEHDLERLLAWL